MKPLNGILSLATAAALAATALAQTPPASFKKLTPDQRSQINTKLKAPGLQIVKDLDLPPTFECEQDFRQAIREFQQAVSACASLESPAPGSPIDTYNKATASQQFNTCKDFPDEFACFNQKLIPDQQRFCENANQAQKRAAEKTRAICVAKECAKIDIKIKAAQNTIAESEKKLADARKALAEAQKDKQQARCN